MLVDMSAGISRLLAPSALPPPRPSEAFTSPEQLAERAPPILPQIDALGRPVVVVVGPRADIWGLGATLLYLRAKLPAAGQVAPPPAKS